MGHDENRMVRWISNVIVNEWIGQKTASLALSLFEGSKYTMLDYQPAEPAVGIQCGGWCDFEFTGAEERAIMEELKKTNYMVFDGVMNEMLTELNERHRND